jgi:hypothetical protein
MARHHSGSSGDKRKMTETGVLICGHGSRDEEAVKEFELLAAALRPRFPSYDFATGYGRSTASAPSTRRSTYGWGAIWRSTRS